jgi:hypothetical protein
VYDHVITRRLSSLGRRRERESTFDQQQNVAASALAQHSARRPDTTTQRAYQGAPGRWRACLTRATFACQVLGCCPGRQVHWHIARLPQERCCRHCHAPGTRKVGSTTAAKSQVSASCRDPIRARERVFSTIVPHRELWQLARGFDKPCAIRTTVNNPAAIAQLVSAVSTVARQARLRARRTVLAGRGAAAAATCPRALARGHTEPVNATYMHL